MILKNSHINNHPSPVPVTHPHPSLTLTRHFFNRHSLDRARAVRPPIHSFDWL